jgi:hypothetical protein
MDEEELGFPRQLGVDVFALWMTSPLLEVQLKPHHKPFYIRRSVNLYTLINSSKCWVSLLKIVTDKRKKLLSRLYILLNKFFWLIH